MSILRLARLQLLSLVLACHAAPALAQDAQLCFDTADRIVEGAQVSDEEKRAAHEACQRALAQTSSVVQKYHLQEADFDILGTRPSKQ